MTTTNQPIGVTFASFQGLGIHQGIDVAAGAAALGYDSFWTAETIAQEAFSTLAAVGASQPSLGLGTGVLALQLRTPMLAAMGAATLQDLSPQATIRLGVGVSSPVVVNRWHGATYSDRPLTQTREYLKLLRECLSGEQVTHQGDFYECSRFRLGVRLGERRPQIVLGALNTKMLQLAGELADGVLLNYLPAAAVPWCVEQVRQGESKAGRASGACQIFAYVHVGVCDRDAALPFARKDLFSYAVVPAYAKAFTRAGFGDEVEAVTSAHRAGNREGALAAISDRMVDAIDICGSPETVAAAVAAYREAGVDHPVIMPLPWDQDRRGAIDATLRAAVISGSGQR